MARVVELLLNTLDGGSLAEATLINRSKAFDLVAKDVLNNKIKCVGMVNKYLHWIQNYLSNRKQFLEIKHLPENARNKFSSPTEIINSVVP